MLDDVAGQPLFLRLALHQLPLHLKNSLDYPQYSNFIPKFYFFSHPVGPLACLRRCARLLLVVEIQFVALLVGPNVPEICEFQKLPTFQFYSNFKILDHNSRNSERILLTFTFSIRRKNWKLSG